MVFSNQIELPHLAFVVARAMTRSPGSRSSNAVSSIEGITLINGILIDSRIEPLREDSLASKIGSPYMIQGNLMRDEYFAKS